MVILLSGSAAAFARVGGVKRMPARTAAASLRHIVVPPTRIQPLGTFIARCSLQTTDLPDKSFDRTILGVASLRGSIGPPDRRRANSNFVRRFMLVRLSGSRS